jgi:hypothetical protein
MKDKRQVEYLARAREAERRARDTEDAAARNLWSEIAEGYRLMAEAQVLTSRGQKAA